MEAVWIALIAAGLALILVFRFPDEIRRLMRRTESIEVTVTGIAWRTYREAVRTKEHREVSRESAETVLGHISGGRILWVDDSPVNNRLEARVLRARGVEVDIATSNDEAILYLSDTVYDLVISDIRRERPEPETAGLELPERLEGIGSEASLVFYTGSADGPVAPSGQSVFDVPTDLFSFIAKRLPAV